MSEELRQIKQDLRAMMNGIASAAMRSSADYRVNFGVELPRLFELAGSLRTTSNPSLPQELWQENVRECRILALMLQPSDTFDEDLCDVWVSQIHTAELAQIAALYLFSHLPYAITKALEWIAYDQSFDIVKEPQSLDFSQQPILPICGYSTLLHIHRRQPLDLRTLQEVNDQASATVTNSLFLKKLLYQWTNIHRQ